MVEKSAAPTGSRGWPGRPTAAGSPTLPDAEPHRALHPASTRNGKVTPVTRPDFFDVGPAFDPEGKYLYFISSRVFDPVYDGHYFDLGFPQGAGPFLIPLRRDVASPFPSATQPARAPGLRTATAAPRTRSRRAAGRRARAKVEIDFDGIEDRVVAFPVPEGRYRRIRGAQGPRPLLLDPREGSLDTTLEHARAARQGAPAGMGLR